MKIIDLLNKIANDEKVPNVIKYQGNILSYDRQSQDYYCEEYGNLFEYLINEIRTSEFLNNEVEIIEEDKKIEKIKMDDQDRIQALSTGNYVYKVNQPTKNIIYKINEIIDYLTENKQ